MPARPADQADNRHLELLPSASATSKRGIKTLATFWHGPPLSALDIAGLLSFQAHGFSVEVYTYDDIPKLPRQLAARNAADIIGREYVDGFVIRGRPSLSHFSDLFRYALFAKTDAAWIDTDLLCLQNFSISASGHFLTKEAPDRLNGAILRLDRHTCDVTALLEAAASYARRADFQWGATGPRLITRHLGSRCLEQAHDVASFYPVHWDKWWMPFLPAYAAECASLCTDSIALHLWNNIIDKAGLWKDLAPPEGSFLHTKLKELDLLHHFVAPVPGKVMETLAANYGFMQTGELISLRELTKTLRRRATSKLRGGISA